MHVTTRNHRIAVVLSVIGALLILGGTAQAATSKPAGMSTAAYRALLLRSEALNDRYGLAASDSGALLLRSQALNDKYGLGGSAVAAPATRPQHAVAAADAFAWGDFGIGAAAMLGLLVLVAGLITGGRLGRGALRARSSS